MPDICASKSQVLHCTRTYRGVTKQASVYNPYQLCDACALNTIRLLVIHKRPPALIIVHTALYAVIGYQKVHKVRKA
jgi:hypothetical protein